MKLSTQLNHKSTFSEKVEHNNNICSNCYRRLSVTLEPHRELPDCVTNHIEYSDSVEFGYFEGRKPNSSHPSVKKSYCECGVVDESKIRPLSKDELMESAHRVRERLEEQDVELDVDEYYSFIREEKSNPQNQFNEEKILEKAVAFSEE